MSKPPLRFELLIPRGGEPLDHVRFDELYEAVKARFPRLVSLGYNGRVDEAELMRRPGGLVGGQPIPVIEIVSVEVDGEATFEEMRAHIGATLAEDLGRPDIIVAVA